MSSMLENMLEASLGYKKPCLMGGGYKIPDYVVNKGILDSYSTLQIFTRYC